MSHPGGSQHSLYLAERFSITYERAEARYRQGLWTQEDWEEYCGLWRNSAFRYSDLAVAYQDETRGGETE